MKNYGLTPPAELHPAGTTEQVFDETKKALRDEIQQLERRLGNWQRCNGALCVIAVLLTGAVVHLSNNVKVFTYVVEVAEPGQVRNVGILPQTWRDQTPAVIEHTMRDWLYRMRRVGTDPVVQTDQLLGANAFMTAAAITMAKPYVQERFELQKKEWTTQVDIGVMLPLSSDFHAVEVEWRERTYNRQGGLVSDDKWKAIINIVIFAPEEVKNPREMRNPLGIFVSDFSWAKTGKSTS